MSNPVEASENENPGASANATGANNNDLAITSEQYRVRLANATSLCFAIADCDPRDACLIMDAALRDLSAGQPGVAFYSFAQEATWWADLACEAEAKAYLWACWQRLSPSAQAAFLGYVQGRAAA